MRFTSFVLIAFFASRCGVEAGNVGKGRTGQVKVLFSQESVSGNESLNVTVGSLGLLSSDDTEGATLSPSVATVDLYSKTDSGSVLVAESNVIPAGSYAKIAIRLSGEKPVRYRDENGNDHDVSLDDDTKESFYITQEIKVMEGETTTIVVNLDPYHSLARPDADRFVFSPRGEVSGQGLDHRYTGATTLSNAKWACIYAFDLADDRGPLGPGMSGSRWGNDNRYGSGPYGNYLQGDAGRFYRGREVEGRPAFGSKSEIVKDETSDCSSAFAKTPVKNGKFEFRYLNEGVYSLRIFASNGSYEDVSEDIIIDHDD